MPPELLKYIAATIPTIAVPVAYKLGLPEGLCAGLLAVWGAVVGAHVGKDLMRTHHEAAGKKKP
jgi:hypothetical protein